ASRTKVTRTLAWNSRAPPRPTFTRSSFTQAPRTPRSVFVARSIPWRMASSKDWLEVQESSVTRATDMVTSRLVRSAARPVWADDAAGNRGQAAAFTWLPGQASRASASQVLTTDPTRSD